MKTPEQRLRDAERTRLWKKAHPERVRQLNAESLQRSPRQYTPEQRAAAVQRTKQWGKDNPERAAELRRATVRRYTAKHPERVKQRFRKWVLRTKYNITWEQYHEMLEAQGGCCAICETDKPEGRGQCFHVDHDHKTGRVRGLLCTNCNNMLGRAKDNPALLRKGASFLEAHQLTPDPVLE